MINILLQCCTRVKYVFVFNLCELSRIVQCHLNKWAVNMKIGTPRFDVTSTSIVVNVNVH